MLANVGVPMLFVQMPYLVMSLPLVIAIEAVLCRKWLAVSWGAAWKWTAAANLVSTLIGFPVVWGMMVGLQIVLGGALPSLGGLGDMVLSVTLGAGWLAPYRDRMHWMIPVAGIVLLIPAFFMTVLVEGAIYRRVLAGSAGPVGVRAATWRMHVVTYGVLFVGGLALLVQSLAMYDGSSIPR